MFAVLNIRSGLNYYYVQMFWFSSFHIAVCWFCGRVGGFGYVRFPFRVCSSVSLVCGSRNAYKWEILSYWVLMYIIYCNIHKVSIYIKYIYAALYISFHMYDTILEYLIIRSVTLYLLLLGVHVHVPLFGDGFKVHLYKY